MSEKEGKGTRSGTCGRWRGERGEAHGGCAGVEDLRQRGLERRAGGGLVLRMRSAKAEHEAEHRGPEHSTTK